MIRLACSGAILGIAIVGLLSDWLGFVDSAVKDSLAATIGFAIVVFTHTGLDET